VSLIGHANVLLPAGTRTAGGCSLKKIGKNRENLEVTYGPFGQTTAKVRLLTRAAP
jgi:hypothetical protein